jgi:Zn-dependent M28 family amino/carboxypeptidase
MKRLLFLLLFSSFLLRSQNIAVPELKKHIAYLASDLLKGRGTSSEEEKMAAAYIAKEFKKYGLKPGNKDSYLYEFKFRKNLDPHDTSTANVPERKGQNVIAYLDNQAPYTIVIGAHYDHLGLGHDKNSRDPEPDGKIHNGADDNASGTSGVLALANYYSANKIKENYNFLFMCYSGEELGLIGSKKWCEAPTFPLEKITYMINMDMIGRLNDSTKKLIIYGVGTSPVWVPVIDSIKSNFTIKKDSAGIGPSDQTSFYLKNIPVLHFFTGQHEDYHKPGDDADKINYEGEAAVLEYIIRVINATNKLDKLTFLKTRNPDTGKSSFKVTMGVMPDYAFEGKGLRIDGVTDGKPASKAGLQKGDVVIQLGDQDVKDIQEYMKALSKHNKGDTVPVKILRDGKEMEMKVTF